MMEKEDWLFRPVLRGMLRAESLMDGSVDISYIALLNEAIEVEQENTLRFHRHEMNKNPR
jgi:hypothetical protein